MDDAQLLATIRRMIREERNTARAGMTAPLVLPGTVTTGGLPAASILVRLDGESASHAVFNATGVSLVTSQRVYVTLVPPHGAMVTGIITTGAWTDYTPILAQGVSTNIGITVGDSRYVKEGRKVTWNWFVTATAAGTAGSAVTLSLPFTARGGGVFPGTSWYYDGSAVQNYVGATTIFSTTTIAVAADQQSGNNVGAVPNIAVASDDQWRGFIVYEAAS